ncbi:MAG: glycosyltransferase family 2 protein [Pseudomonadota bacterium]|jgi:succinoglycan biosynthesis protein ExoO
MVQVSIIIPVYNAADFIADALESVRAQTFADWECIVVDDCSTDRSSEILLQFAARDDRIKAVFLEENGGASRARNAALEKATGQWITLLDADDVYDVHRLNTLVTLAQDRSADLVFDNQIIADFPSTQPVGRAFHWLTQADAPFSAEQFFKRSAIFGRSLNPGYMKPLFSRAFIEDNRLRYDPQFRSGQDYLFYANAFARGPRCFATSYAGYVYRRRKGSLSRSGGTHLRNHARLSDEILTRHGTRLSKASCGALRSRKRYFMNAAALYDVRLALNARSLGKAVSIMVREPGSVVGAVAQVRRRVMAFLTGQK